LRASDDFDAASLGELDRVADEVDENLLKSMPVGPVPTVGLNGGALE